MKREQVSWSSPVLHAQSLDAERTPQFWSACHSHSAWKSTSWRRACLSICWYFQHSEEAAVQIKTEIPNEEHFAQELDDAYFDDEDLKGILLSDGRRRRVNKYVHMFTCFPFAAEKTSLQLTYLGWMQDLWFVKLLNVIVTTFHFVRRHHLLRILFPKRTSKEKESNQHHRFL